MNPTDDMMPDAQFADGAASDTTPIVPVAGDTSLAVALVERWYANRVTALAVELETRSQTLAAREKELCEVAASAVRAGREHAAAIAMLNARAEHAEASARRAQAQLREVARALVPILKHYTLFVDSCMSCREEPGSKDRVQDAREMYLLLRPLVEGVVGG